MRDAVRAGEGDRSRFALWKRKGEMGEGEGYVAETAIVRDKSPTRRRRKRGAAEAVLMALVSWRRATTKMTKRTLMTQEGSSSKTRPEKKEGKKEMNKTQITKRATEGGREGRRRKDADTPGPFDWGQDASRGRCKRCVSSSPPLRPTPPRACRDKVCRRAKHSKRLTNGQRLSLSLCLSGW